MLDSSLADHMPSPHGKPVRQRILLLSSRSDVRKPLVVLLEADGHAIIRSTTLGDALSRLRLAPYDLVLAIARTAWTLQIDDFQPLVGDPRRLPPDSNDFHAYRLPASLHAPLLVIALPVDARRIRDIVRGAMSRLSAGAYDLGEGRPASASAERVQHPRATGRAGRA